MGKPSLLILCFNTCPFCFVQNCTCLPDGDLTCVPLTCPKNYCNMSTDRQVQTIPSECCRCEGTCSIDQCNELMSLT